MVAIQAIANSAKDHVTSYTYDMAGQVTLSLDSSGTATQYQYDAFGDVLQTTTSTYPASGTVRMTRNVYDNNGRVVLSVDAMGSATSLSYDVNDHVVQQRQYARTVPASLVQADSDAALLALVALTGGSRQRSRHGQLL